MFNTICISNFKTWGDSSVRTFASPSLNPFIFAAEL